MAPLAIGDKVNITALAGTWLGTIFTGVGLIALISQLQSVLKGIRHSRRSLLIRSAGAWIDLIPKANVPQQGLVEALVPRFLGFVQKAYLADKPIFMTQGIRQNQGNSGWSNLFAHAGINPQDLIKFGGPDAYIEAAVTGGGRAPPRLADVIFEDSRILYGFSRTEFAALLVICHFHISDLHLHGNSTSVDFLGTMHLADYGPFSQIARFDAHEGCREISRELERYMSAVPVRRCIDLALGIIRTRKRGDHAMIIPPSVHPSDIGAGYELWKVRPEPRQLNEIRYALEQLVSVSGADVLTYSVDTPRDLEYDSSAWKRVLPTGEVSIEEARQILLVAHALASLQPWELLPSLPNWFIGSFRPLLEPFVGTHAETVRFLQDRMRQLRLKPIEGWRDIDEQAAGLKVGEVKTDFFSHSASLCRNYFKAMNLVFESGLINVDDVQVTLAAQSAYNLLGPAKAQVNEELFNSNMQQYLKDTGVVHLVPGWAVTVYATFLWGWINDSNSMDLSFNTRFQRRVFLS